MTDGILNVYKEKGMTSFGVIARLRSILKIKKIGHTGTLDPDATGVLPVCIGKATKLSGMLTDTDKSYSAQMLLGKKTDTQDISGEIIYEMTEDEVFKSLGIDKNKEELENLFKGVFDKFVGEIEQVPPMYSAIKINGQKLCDLARKGSSLKIKPRKITIYEIENIKADDLSHISFDVHCSKGTYVRTICEDAGSVLNIPACLSSLERTRAAGLHLSDSIKLAEVEKLFEAGTLDEHIIPIDHFFEQYPKIIVNDIGLKKVLNGNFLDENDMITGNSSDEICRIYDENKNFYALYKLDKKRNCFIPEKMFL